MQKSLSKAVERFENEAAHLRRTLIAIGRADDYEKIKEEAVKLGETTEHTATDWLGALRRRAMDEATKRENDA